MFAIVDHLNRNAGALSVVIGGFVLMLLAWMLIVQQQQLRTLLNWEEERQTGERQRQALEHARMALEEAQLVDRLAREQLVHKSREDVAQATALLHQLKRQFG